MTEKLIAPPADALLYLAHLSRVLEFLRDPAAVTEVTQAALDAAKVYEDRLGAVRTLDGAKRAEAAIRERQALLDQRLAEVADERERIAENARDHAERAAAELRERSDALAAKEAESSQRIAKRDEEQNARQRALDAREAAVKAEEDRLSKESARADAQRASLAEREAHLKEWADRMKAAAGLSA